MKKNNEPSYASIEEKQLAFMSTINNCLEKADFFWYNLSGEPNEDAYLYGESACYYFEPEDQTFELRFWEGGWNSMYAFRQDGVTTYWFYNPYGFFILTEERFNVYWEWKRACAEDELEYYEQFLNTPPHDIEIMRASLLSEYKVMKDFAGYVIGSKPIAYSEDGKEFALGNKYGSASGTIEEVHDGIVTHHILEFNTSN